MPPEQAIVAIGFRAAPSCIHWAAVRGTKTAPELVDDDTFPAPGAESEAEALSTYRREVLAIVQRVGASRAWVRVTEQSPGSKAPLMRRCRIEGVIMATLDAAGVNVALGALGSIKAQVKKGNAGSTTKSKALKTPGEKPVKAGELLAEDSFRGLDWSRKKKEIREAILAGVGMLA